MGKSSVTGMFRRSDQTSWSTQPESIVFIAASRMCDADILLASLVRMWLGRTRPPVVDVGGSGVVSVNSTGVSSTDEGQQSFLRGCSRCLGQGDSSLSLRPGQEARVLCSSQAEIPIQFIFPGVFAVIIYLMAGLPLGAKPFLLFIAYVVLTSNAAVSLG